MQPTTTWFQIRRFKVFQFSWSLIATYFSCSTARTQLSLSILLESYCNRRSVASKSRSISDFNSPRVLLQRQSRRSSFSLLRLYFNSPRVLLQHIKEQIVVEMLRVISILLESYCNRTGAVQHIISNVDFNSPRVLLQLGWYVLTR